MSDAVAQAFAWARTLSPATIRHVIMGNMTCRPPYRPRELALMWMQGDAPRWAGYEPGECVSVAEYLEARGGGGPRTQAV